MNNLRKTLAKVLAIALLIAGIYTPAEVSSAAEVRVVPFQTAAVTVRSLNKIKSYTNKVAATAVTSRDAVSVKIITNSVNVVTQASVKASDANVDVTYDVAAKVTSKAAISLYVIKTTTETAVTTKQAVDDDGDKYVKEVEKKTAYVSTVAAINLTVEAADKTKSLKVDKAYKTVIIPAGGKLAVPYQVVAAAGATTYKPVKSIIKNSKVIKKAIVNPLTNKVRIKVPKAAVKGTNTLVTLKSGNKTAKIKVFVQNKVKKFGPKALYVSGKKGSVVNVEYIVKKAQNNSKPVATPTKVKYTKKGLLKFQKAASKKGKITLSLKAKKKGQTKVTLVANGKKASQVIVNVK